MLSPRIIGEVQQESDHGVNDIGKKKKIYILCGVPVLLSRGPKCFQGYGGTIV